MVGTQNYSSVKAYMHLLGYYSIHPNSEMDLKNQMSNKAQGLFLLLLQDWFNTRGCYGIYSSDALLQKIAGNKLGSAFQFGYIQREPSKE
jgi:hypothetical protein